MWDLFLHITTNLFGSVDAIKNNRKYTCLGSYLKSRNQHYLNICWFIPYEEKLRLWASKRWRVRFSVIWKAMLKFRMVVTWVALEQRLKKRGSCSRKHLAIYIHSLFLLNCWIEWLMHLYQISTKQALSNYNCGERDTHCSSNSNKIAILYCKK